MIGMNNENYIPIHDTFSAWSDILVRQLQKRVVLTGIQDWTKIRPYLSGQMSLFNSIRFIQESGSETVQKGLLSYNVSGMFAELGVGREYSRGNSGKIDKVHIQRKAKNWNSKLFYASIMRLGEIMQEKHAKGIQDQMVVGFEKLNGYK
jgi:hypothetical protein